MSEMVERVAAEIFDSVTQHTMKAVWADQPMDVRIMWLAAARAAIAAMREPTSAMCEASLKNDWTFADSVNSYAGPIERWRAMIDEALR